MMKICKFAVMLSAVLIMCACSMPEKQNVIDINKIIEEVSNDLESENWTDIGFTKGLPQRDWPNEEFHKVLEEGCDGNDVYTVCGRISVKYKEYIYEYEYPTITAVARIVYDEHNPEGKRMRVWYICDNGKYVSSDALGIDGVNLHDEHKATIVDAYHSGLWSHMFSVHDDIELLLSNLDESAVVKKIPEKEPDIIQDTDDGNAEQTVFK